MGYLVGEFAENMHGRMDRCLAAKDLGATRTSAVNLTGLVQSVMQMERGVK